MKSSLFKPVYFTKPVMIARTSSSSSQLVPPRSYLKSKESNENINYNSSIPDININKSKKHDSKPYRSTLAEVEGNDIYIARPSRGLISSHRINSSSLTRSFSMSEIPATELVFTPKMKPVKKSHSALADCNQEIHKDNVSTKVEQKSPKKNHHNQMLSQIEKYSFQFTGFPKSRNSPSLTGGSLLFQSIPEQLSSTIKSVIVEGATAVISNSESHESAEPTIIRINHDSNNNVLKSKREPGDDLISMANKILPIPRDKKYIETRTFMSPITLSQTNSHSDLLRDKVVYLKYSGANQWALSTKSDPKVKQLLSSALYFCPSVSEILPIQHIETDQISKFHRSYQMAKTDNLEILESALIFKTVSSLTVDPCRLNQIHSFESIHPQLPVTIIEMIKDEIKTDPFNQYKAHRVEVEEHLHRLAENNSRSAVEYETNGYCSEVIQIQTIQTAEWNIHSSISCTPEMSLASPDILLEALCDSQEFEQIVPDISASNSAVPSSISLSQEAINQRVMLDLCKLKCNLLKVSHRQSSLSRSLSEGLAHESAKDSRSVRPTESMGDQDFLKLECTYKSNLSSVSSKSSISDQIVIPRILIEDGLQNEKSNSLLVTEKTDPQIQDEMLRDSKLSISNSEHSQNYDVTDSDDTTYVLIPEGYPGGLIDNSKTNDIYLNYRAVHNHQIYAPKTESSFEIKESKFSGKSLRSPERTRKVIHQSLERDINTPVIKIDSTHTQRNGIIYHVSCTRDNSQARLLKIPATISPWESPKKIIPYTINTPVLKFEKEVDSKFGHDDTMVANTKDEEEETKGHEVAEKADQEFNAKAQKEEIPIIKIDSISTDEDVIKQNLGKYRCGRGVTLKCRSNSPVRRASCSKCILDDNNKLEKFETRSLKEKRLKELKNKCRELQRELGKLPSARADEKNDSSSTASINSSNSCEKIHRSTKKRSISRTHGKKNKSSGRRRRHQSKYKNGYTTSSSSDYTQRSRRYKHRCRLPPHVYPTSSPISHNSYPYSSYPYYPPPYMPPPLPPHNYIASPPPHQPVMMMEPWIYPGFHSSRQRCRYKPRRSSRYHHHRHRKASSSKHKPEKEETVYATSTQNKASNEGNGIPNREISRTDFYGGFKASSCARLSLPQLNLDSPSPPSPLHPLNESPRGIYELSEANNPHFNPFKGNSLQNEPPNFEENHISSNSSPIRRDSSLNFNYYGSVMVPNRDNQLQSPRSPQMHMPSGSPITNTMTPQPPDYRMYQNDQPRESLDTTMHQEEDHVQTPSLPTRDGPQVTCTGDKFGLFRLPTTNDEYASCERRFDWLQSEKTSQEKSLNQLDMEFEIGGPKTIRSRQEEVRVTGALNQIEREMSALRLVMKKYAIEKKKFRRLKN